MIRNRNFPLWLKLLNNYKNFLNWPCLVKTVKKFISRIRKVECSKPSQKSFLSKNNDTAIHTDYTCACVCECACVCSLPHVYARLVTWLFIHKWRNNFDPTFTISTRVLPEHVWFLCSIVRVKRVLYIFCEYSTDYTNQASVFVTTS